jgi:hypothetical protein
MQGLGPSIMVTRRLAGIRKRPSAPLYLGYESGTFIVGERESGRWFFTTECLFFLQQHGPKKARGRPAVGVPARASKLPRARRAPRQGRDR